MKDNKAYFRIYGEKARAKSRAPKRAGKHAPDWFNYQVDELSDLNPLKKYLNVGGIPMTLKNDKESFIRNIKKTKVGQIKYMLEDMDEEVRRLKNAVLYVGFCNRQLKIVLKNEDKTLQGIMTDLKKILRNSIVEEPMANEQGVRHHSGHKKAVSNKPHKKGQLGLEKENQGHSKSHKKSQNGFERDKYMISAHVSANTTGRDEETNEDEIPLPRDFGNDQDEDSEIEEQFMGGYLLKQLQRQLLEMNNKLKHMKMNLEELMSKENFLNLKELKTKIKDEKNNKNEQMLKLHKVNEKFIQQKISEDKLEILKRK